MSHEVVSSQRPAESSEVSETCRRGLHVFLLGVLSFVRSTASHVLDWAAISSTFRPSHISEEVASQIWQQLFANSIMDSVTPLTDANDPSLNAPSPEQLSMILHNLGQPLKSTLALLQVCSHTFPHVNAERKAPKRPLEDTDHPFTAPRAIDEPNKRARTPSSPCEAAPPAAIPSAIPSLPCGVPSAAGPAPLDTRRRPDPLPVAAAAAAACTLPTLAILSPNQSVALTPNSSLALSAAALPPPPRHLGADGSPRPPAAAYTAAAGRPLAAAAAAAAAGPDPKDSEPESDGEVRPPDRPPLPPPRTPPPSRTQTPPPQPPPRRRPRSGHALRACAPCARDPRLTGRRRSCSCPRPVTTPSCEAPEPTPARGVVPARPA
jgi:hypothetical protein